MSMKKLPWLIGNALAGYMDFGLGALIATVVSLWWNVAPEWWYLLIGAFFALLPDLDVVVTILAGKPSNIDHHQTLLHRPTFMLPLVALILFISAGAFWSTLATLCLLWHYLHDTKGLSEGGVAWFWPVSKKYWSLTGGYMPHHIIPDHLQWIQKNGYE
jgi:hypothetical protein